MSQFKSLTQVELLVKPIVENLGLIFVDCDLKKLPGGLTLTIYIDKQNGVSLEHCEQVSKAIDEPLDELDVTNGVSYNLNVSSPGLDRPLLRKVDYERNLNCEIEVKFYKPFTNGKKLIVGTLESYNDTSFIIITNNEKIEINKDIVALATPVLKW